MKLFQRLILFTILPCCITDKGKADQPPSWAVLTTGNDFQMQSKAPVEIRGTYLLLQVAMNDREWKDVSKANIHFMTLDANSTTENLGGAQRTIQKVATKMNGKGNLLVIMLLSDNTTLMIELWDPAKKLALVTGDERDATGAVNTIKMRCCIRQD